MSLGCRPLIFLVLLWTWGQLAAQETTTWAERVLQNELLRDHFREEVWRETGQGDYHYSSTPPYSTGGIPSNLGSIERSNTVRIDEQVSLKIVQLLDKLNREFAELRSASRQLSSLSLRCRQSQDHFFSKEHRRTLENQLKVMRDSARDLHKWLREIYSSLPAEGTEDLDSLIGEESDQCIVQAVNTLSEKILGAERRSREILAGGYLVILDELKTSVLSELDTVQSLADRLRKRY